MVQGCAKKKKKKWCTNLFLLLIWLRARSSRLGQRFPPTLAAQRCWPFVHVQLLMFRHASSSIITRTLLFYTSAFCIVRPTVKTEGNGSIALGSCKGTPLVACVVCTLCCCCCCCCCCCWRLLVCCLFASCDQHRNRSHTDLLAFVVRTAETGHECRNR